jgi:uncharacterized membrane protein YedE/YeeE
MTGSTLAPPAGASGASGRPAAALANAGTLAGFLTYVAMGAAFAFVLTKAEAVSWYRIHEMFRFQSFHMFGILGSAVAVAAAGIALIRRFKLKSVSGEPIEVPPKVMGKGYRYLLGGTIFGLGWALIGACPGPFFALVGSGATVFIVVVLSALAGTYVYGVLRPKLPH